MFTSESFIHFLIFLLGFATVILTLSSALSTFVLPCAARSQLNRIVFGLFRRLIDFIDIPNPQDPHYPSTQICVERPEFDDVLDQLAAAGVPLKADREQAWRDFAGWRVNYDRTLILLCGLVMAPRASWSSDRVPEFVLPPMMIFKKKDKLPLESETV